MTNWLDRQVSARVLLAWLCLTAPSMLVSSSPAVRAAQLAVLIVVAVGMRRRIRWGRTALFFAAVVVFNLATPGGRVLAAPAGIPVTAGALEVGLTKAFGLTGLLVLSKAGIRRDLRLPGRAGRLLDLTLAYVRAFLSADVKLLARDPVGRLDNLLRDGAARGGCRSGYHSHSGDAAGRRRPGRPVTAASWAAAPWWRISEIDGRIGMKAGSA